MKTLSLDLGARGYPIHIGDGLLERAELYRPHTEGRTALVVSDETVAPLYLARVLDALGPSGVHQLVLPDGEQHKTLGTLELVIDAAMRAKLPRDGVMLALGGGVIGDITGFAAACYQRGVRYVQLPTTLLAQVDSSVGGKTAVNHPAGKNMIGAFHQPSCVIADTSTLATLAQREYAAGLAEVVKYGLIRDRPFFEWLERNVNALAGRETAALEHAIERSCRNKADVVTEDEREAGTRALLNLGHTFGHAIEAGLGFGEWLHGEAVAAGMCMAADLSVRIGWLPNDALRRTRALLEAFGLPTAAPAGLSSARVRELMQVDKKVESGRMRLVLLREIGVAELTVDVDQNALGATLDECREAA